MTGRAGLAASPGEAVARVQLVTGPGCHLCAQAREVLERIGSDMALEVTEVDLESPDGRAALARWRVPFLPIVVLNGTLHSYGRLSERKLRGALANGGK